ncbi:MAG: DUF2085 domain-containing protein [Bacteroidota bacterium]|nr:DUF2085 domain-containing protein [Bacteroidota bacterium]
MPKFRNISVEVDHHLAKKVYFTILIFTFIWLLLIFLAPLFMKWGGAFENVSSFIYLFFSRVCHQQQERSFQLFEYTFGVCSRCVSIYSGFFMGTVFYSLKYKLNNTHPPPIWFLIIASIILILDVSLDSIGIMKNNFLSRSITGLLIGLVLPFYIIPGFVNFFYEVNSFLRKKINI